MAAVYTSILSRYTGVRSKPAHTSVKARRFDIHTLRSSSSSFIVKSSSADETREWQFPLLTFSTISTPVLAIELESVVSVSVNVWPFGECNSEDVRDGSREGGWSSVKCARILVIASCSRMVSASQLKQAACVWNYESPYTGPTFSIVYFQHALKDIPAVTTASENAEWLVQTQAKSQVWNTSPLVRKMCKRGEKETWLARRGLCKPQSFPRQLFHLKIHASHCMRPSAVSKAWMRHPKRNRSKP